MKFHETENSMAKKSNNPTMNDVAREAGVALGTVSKVVNGIRVGEEYRVKVEQAIKKLDYHINNYAQGLKSGKTRAIAVIMPNLVSPYFASLVNSIGKALAAKKHHMVFFGTDYDPDMEQDYVRLAEQQKVDGIICLSYNPDLQVSPDVPMVSIDRYFGAQIPCVSSDNYGGGRLAAEKLVENGCKNLAFLRIGSKLPKEPNKRKDGFISGAQDAIGICIPGLCRHLYDAHYWPKQIERCDDERILHWLEVHLCLIPMFPRRPDCSVIEGKQIDEANVKALTQAADECWDAIMKTDLSAFANAYQASFQAQTALFPAMMQPGVQDYIDRYSAMPDVLAWKMPGAGGGGYLALVVKDAPTFCQAHEEAIPLTIRRPATQHPASNI